MSDCSGFLTRTILKSRSVDIVDYDASSDEDDGEYRGVVDLLGPADGEEDRAETPGVESGDEDSVDSEAGVDGGVEAHGENSGDEDAAEASGVVESGDEGAVGSGDEGSGGVPGVVESGDEGAVGSGGVAESGDEEASGDEETPATMKYVDLMEADPDSSHDAEASGNSTVEGSNNPSEQRASYDAESSIVIADMPESLDPDRLEESLAIPESPAPEASDADSAVSGSMRVGDSASNLLAELVRRGHIRAYATLHIPTGVSRSVRETACRKWDTLSATHSDLLFTHSPSQDPHFEATYHCREGAPGGVPIDLDHVEHFLKHRDTRRIYSLDDIPMRHDVGEESVAVLFCTGLVSESPFFPAWSRCEHPRYWCAIRPKVTEQVSSIFDKRIPADADSVLAITPSRSVLLEAPGDAIDEVIRLAW